MRKGLRKQQRKEEQNRARCLKNSGMIQEVLRNFEALDRFHLVKKFRATHRAAQVSPATSKQDLIHGLMRTTFGPDWELAVEKKIIKIAEGKKHNEKDTRNRRFDVGAMYRED